MTKMKDAAVSGSRLGRLAKLGAMGLRAGAGMLQSTPNETAAKLAAQSLSQMRGIATKVGQMAAYIDGVVPEAQSDTYQQWMKGLLDQTTASPFSDVRRLVEEETRRPLEASFVEFDEQPIASASIGQVHRARLHQTHPQLPGAEVAVKVQHIGVAEAVRADLKNAGMLEGLLALAGTRKFESKRVLEEIRARFGEELDYALEAERQRTFAVHNPEPSVVVPTVVNGLSTARMLTMQFVRGAKLDAFIAEAGEEERQQAAATMWRFVYRTSILHGLFNADPHPGNFMFRPEGAAVGGAVAFLDFGCVQRSEQPRRGVAHQVHLAAMRKDEAEFRRLGAVMLDLRGGRFETLALDYLREAFRPQFDSPFKITRPYVAALVKQFRDAGIESVKAKGDDVVPLPEGVFFMNRLQFGFYSVMARLDVAVDYAAVERGFL